MAPTRLIQLSVWETRVDGPYQPRGIKAGDWRDKDLVIQFHGATVYPKDENREGHSEPDWDQGWEVREGDRTLPFKGTGRPPDIIAEAFLQGRVLYGVLIARDEQQHG